MVKITNLTNATKIPKVKAMLPITGFELVTTWTIFPEFKVTSA